MYTNLTNFIYKGSSNNEQIKLSRKQHRHR